MACESCTNTECITLYVNPCDTGINTGIILDETGDYTILITFNGTVQRYSIQVVAGRPIILNNVLNAPYVHAMTIYNDDGVLVNDTCYKLNTMLAINPNNLTPNPPCGAKEFITIEEDGESVTNPFFDLYIISAIDTNNQAFIKDVDFTQSGDTITFINGNILTAGQVILAWA